MQYPLPAILIDTHVAAQKEEIFSNLKKQQCCNNPKASTQKKINIGRYFFIFFIISLFFIFLYTISFCKIFFYSTIHEGIFIFFMHCTVCANKNI